MVPMLKIITLRVPDDLKRSLDQLSRARGVSRSALAREALQRYLAGAEVRRLRAMLVPRAHAQGVQDDEDVFRRIDRR